jgi:hypothetical protein
VTFALARSLLLADAVTSAALAEALLVSVTRRTSLVRALLGTGAIDPVRLEPLLERGGAPYMRHISPVTFLVQRLPSGLCDRLLAIPVREDPRTKTVDVAIVDARDPHPVEEVGYWLRAPVRMVRTSIASMEAALQSLAERIDAEPAPGMRALAPPIWAPSPPSASAMLAQTPGFGLPTSDARKSSHGSHGSHGSRGSQGSQGTRALADGPEREGGDQDIAIPLTRRNFSPDPVIELSPESVRRSRHETDPILYLKRRKAGAPHLEDPLAGLAEVAADAPAPQAATDALKSAPAVAEVIDEMRQTHERDRILDLLVAGMIGVARRVAVLAVRRDALVGWSGSPELADRAALRGVRLANAMRTVLHEALEQDGARLARMPTDAAHAPLLSIMSPHPSGQIAVASVRTEGKAVAVVFAADLGDATAAIQRMTLLAGAAGESLGRLLRERRK